MELEDLGNWLFVLLLFGLQATVAYAIGRAIWLGGGLVINPFQPGWGTLAAHYGTGPAPVRMQSTSARVGATTYRNTLRLAYGLDALFLEDGLFEAAGVSLALPTNEARALIEELAYAELARAKPAAAASPAAAAPR